MKISNEAKRLAEENSSDLASIIRILAEEMQHRSTVGQGHIWKIIENAAILLEYSYDNQQ
jgi:hypothetical protein